MNGLLSMDYDGSRSKNGEDLYTLVDSEGIDIASYVLKEDAELIVYCVNEKLLEGETER